MNSGRSEGWVRGTRPAPAWAEAPAVFCFLLATEGSAGHNATVPPGQETGTKMQQRSEGRGSFPTSLSREGKENPASVGNLEIKEKESPRFRG